MQGKKDFISQSDGCASFFSQESRVLVWSAERSKGSTMGDCFGCTGVGGVGGDGCGVGWDGCWSC